MTYDPRLPAIQAIQAKHWRSMTSQNEHLKNVFPEPPLIAFRKQNNIHNNLIKSKVPPMANLYPSIKI